MKRLPAYLARRGLVLPLVALPLFVLAHLLWLSLGAPELTTAHYHAALRTYLARNAFFNSVYTSLGGLALAAVLAWSLMPALARPGPVRRLTCVVLGATLLVPAAPLALWVRGQLEPTLWLTQTSTATLAGTLLLGWRLAPVWALSHVWLGAQKVPPRARWAITGLLVAGIALLDSTLIYLLTFGEPFNATHTAATWAVQQAWVVGHWRDAAAVLLLLYAGMGGIFLLLLNASTRATLLATPPKTPPIHARVRWLWVGFILIGVILLPLWWSVLVTPGFVQWSHLPAALDYLLHVGMAQWVLNTLITIALAGLVAWSVAHLLARASNAQPARRFRLILLTLGLVWLSGGTLLLGWYRAQGLLETADTRIWLALLLGSAAGLLLAGLGIPNRRGARLGGAVGLAAGLIQHDFAASLILAPPSAQALVGLASATHLGALPPDFPVPSIYLIMGYLAVLLTGALALGLRQWHRGRTPDS